VASARTASISSARARATRDRIVPTGTPQIPAASSYDVPTTCVSTKASRRSGDSAAISALSACTPDPSGEVGSATDAASSIRAARRRRRPRARSESAQVRRAIANSQVLALASARYAGRARHART